MSNRALLFSVVCLLSSTPASLFASSVADRIIGENDLVNVPSSYAHYNEIKAIGRMRLGCTVTHVGGGYAITAGHCVSLSPFAGIRYDRECANARYDVTWGVTYGSQGYQTSKCARVVAAEYNTERDYAILMMSPIPKGTIPVDMDEVVVAGDEISIFSHPKKRPLEWSTWCKVDTFFEKSKGHQFGYTCDTEGGSSGAAVLNDDFEIVGIHNFYNGLKNRNGATRLSSTLLGRYIH